MQALVSRCSVMVGVGFVLLTTLCVSAETISVNSNRVHIGDQPELTERFADWGPFVGTTWEVQFSIPGEPADCTLFVESFDVEAPPDFQNKLLLNGSFITNLAYVGPPDWYTAAQSISIPTGTLHAGLNTLRIESGYGQGIYDNPTYDDFGVGQITLSYTPEATALPMMSLTLLISLRRRRER